MTDVVRAQMTLDQAEAVASALDLSSRIMMGQIDEIALLARMGRLHVRDDRAEGGWRDATPEEVDEIERHARSIAAVLGHRGGSFGIGSHGVPISGKRQYEVQKALQKAVADVRSPGGRTVHHDGVTVRYTQDPIPTAWTIHDDDGMDADD